MRTHITILILYCLTAFVSLNAWAQVPSQGNNFVTLSATAEKESPASAFNTARNEFLVVWVDTDPACGNGYEKTLYGKRIDGITGNAIGNSFKITQLNNCSKKMWANELKLHYSSTLNQYLLMYAEVIDFSVGGKMKAVKLDANGSIVAGPSILGVHNQISKRPYESSFIIEKASGNFVVAYDSIASGNHHLRIKEIDTQLDIISELNLNNTHFASSMTSNSGPDRCVAQPNPSDNKLLIITSLHNGTYSEIWAFSVPEDLSSIGTPFRVSGAGATDQKFINPVITYNSTDQEFLVLYESFLSDGPGYDVYGSIVARKINTNYALGAVNNNISVLTTDNSDYEIISSPAISYSSYNHQYYTPFYGEIFTSGAEMFNIYGQSLASTLVKNSTTGVKVVDDAGVAISDNVNNLTMSVANNTTNDRFLLSYYNQNSGQMESVLKYYYNHKPISASISNTQIAENIPAGATIGTLTTVDIDPNESFTYHFLGDNDEFEFVGNTLKSLVSFNYEASSQKTITYYVEDSKYDTITRKMVIQILDVNDAPTNITLTAGSVAENTAVGTTVGTLATTDEDAGDTHTYTLIVGTGSAQNAYFEIDDNQIKIAQPLDYESFTTAGLRVSVSDGTTTYEKALAINVQNVDEAPSGLKLTANTVSENNPQSTFIGHLSATDPEGTAVSYSLTVNGVNNDEFEIRNGNELYTTSVFNYEVAAQKTIEVEARDLGGLTSTASLQIQILNVNEPPTNISLSNTAVSENVNAPHAVGTLTTSDPDNGDTFSYSLTPKSAGNDNDFFSISANGNTLQLIQAPDYESKSTLKTEIRVIDGGLNTYTKTFTLAVINVNEAPTSLELSTSTVKENVATPSIIGYLTATDQDAFEQHYFTLAPASDDNDNQYFNIPLSKNSLQIIQSPNFEATNTLSAEVVVTDKALNTYSQVFTITVSDVNEVPETIKISQNVVDENVATPHVVGQLTATDPDANETFTFNLNTKTQNNDNQYFEITNTNTLNLILSPDYEVDETLIAQITVRDGANNALTQTISVLVSDVNEPIEMVTLSTDTVSENRIGFIGKILVSDPDQDDSFTITFGGEGNDNQYFEVRNDSLFITSAANHEATDTLNIDLDITDSEEHLYNASFKIGIKDINEAPGQLTLSKQSVERTLPVGSLIAKIIATDEDEGDVVKVSLKILNDMVYLTNDSLMLAQTIDETIQTIAITVAATDKGGLTLEKELTISVVEPDLLPPTIVYTGASSFSAGAASATLSFTIEDDNQLDEVWAYYKKALTTNWDSLKLTSENSQFEWNVTASMLDAIGMQYFVRATDVSGKSTKGEERLLSITYNETNSPLITGLDFGGKVSDYRIISIPYILEDKSVDAVFKDDIAPYNNENWRLLHFTQNGYLEHPGTLKTIERGKGYWFNQLNNNSIDIGVATTPDVSADQPFKVQLQKGWNQVGNPYPFDISVWDILMDDANHDKIEAIEGLQIVRYTSNGFEPVNAGKIKKFEGVFIGVNEAIEIVIPVSTEATGGRITQSSDVFEGLTTLSLTGSQFRKTLAFGIRSEAEESFDKYDRFTPPSLDEHNELYFAHPEHDMRAFDFDVKSLTGDGQIWNLRSKNGSQGNVLSWDANQMPDVEAVLLINMDTRLITDMKSEDNVKLEQGNYNLKIMAGTAQWVNAQLENLWIEVGNPYPNPATANSYLPISLPSSNTQYDVSIKIYSTNGQLLHSIKEQLAGGMSYNIDLNPRKNEGYNGLIMYNIDISSEERSLSTHGKILFQSH